MWMRREQLNQGHDPHECRIAFWQGYVMGQFYAYRPGAPEPIRLSPMFRTWALRRGTIPPHDLPTARAALKKLVADLDHRGWRVVGSDVREYDAAPASVVAAAISPENPEAAAMTEEALLEALNRLGGGSGATAAQLGQELLGERAPTVRNLPQRVGSKLRSLRLQGKVERRKNDGVYHWFVTER
jgi:hypothetical protein